MATTARLAAERQRARVSALLATAAERELERDVLAAFAALRAASVAELERALRRRDPAAIHALADRLGPAMKPALRRIERSFLAGARDGDQQLRTVGIDAQFDVLDPDMIEYARDYAADKVRQITDETRAGIREAIVQSMAKGVTPQQTAKAIAPLIGLTRRQARAVAAARAEAVAQGTSRAAAAIASARRAQQMIRQRARTIARTEILAAENGGQVQAWLRAQQNGLLSASAQKVWIVTRDELLAIVGPRVLVATLDGWKPIKDVRVGDHVLTHRDRFCEVTYREVKRYDGKTVVFDFHKRGFNKLQVTYGHPVLVRREGIDEWIVAEHVRETDELYLTARPCVDCGELVARGPRACGRNEKESRCYACGNKLANATRWARPRSRIALIEQNKKLWADPEYKARVSGALAVAARKRFQQPGERIRARDAALKRYMDPDAYARVAETNRRTARYPTHPFRVMSSERREAIRAEAFKARGRKARGGTYIERKVRWFLEKQAIAYEPQWPFRVDGKQRHADFYLPGPNIVVECDGPHHRTDAGRIRDALRDAALNARGIQVLRFDDVMIRARFADVADSIQKHCCFVRVSPEIKHRRIRHQAVYHLTVAGDESFVAGGVVVHNCPMCRALDGKTVGLNELFRGGVGKRRFAVKAPPAHPSCRCASAVRPGPRKPSLLARAGRVVQAHPGAVLAGAAGVAGVAAEALTREAPVGGAMAGIFGAQPPFGVAGQPLGIVPLWEDIGIKVGRYSSLTPMQRTLLRTQFGLGGADAAIPRHIAAGVRAAFADLKKQAPGFFDIVTNNVTFIPMEFAGDTETGAMTVTGAGFSHILFNTSHRTNFMAQPRWWEHLPAGAIAPEEWSVGMRIVRQRQLYGYAAESVYWRHVVGHELGHFVDYGARFPGTREKMSLVVATDIVAMFASTPDPVAEAQRFIAQQVGVYASTAVAETFAELFLATVTKQHMNAVELNQWMMLIRRLILT